MKRKILSIILILALIFPAIPAAASGTFRDVSETAWYYTAVELAARRGLIQGRGNGAFDPGGALTAAEAVKLAAVLHGSFAEKTPIFPAGDPWVSPYADYAAQNGIAPILEDYGASATRAQFAEYIRNALPESALEEINVIAGYDICDVPGDRPYSESVYALYRAGIFTGGDGYNAFLPDRPVTRAQACAVLTRAAESAGRVKLSLPKTIPAEEIYKRSADAVFTIETFDKAGEPVRTGTGFFIAPGGVAATNLHVFDGAVTAVVTLKSGDTAALAGVCAFDRVSDLALLRLGGDFPYLTLADSDLVSAGDGVYSLGSPLGLAGTFSKGVIGYTDRVVGEKTFLQFTSYISQGSGGGALLDTLGRVVGVTSSSFAAGQALNLATPSNLIKELTPGELVPLRALAEASV